MSLSDSAPAELFRVDIKNVNNSSAHLSRPEIVDLIRTDGLTHKKAAHLNYFKEPQRTAYPLDLNKGYEMYNFRKSTFSEYQFIEEYIMNCGYSRLESRTRPATAEQTKIFTRRKILARIMMAPYENLTPDELSDTTVLATRHNGDIYLACGPVRNWSPSQSTTHHFKFEQYCYADSTKHEPNTDVPVNENEQVFGVFHSILKHFQLFYSVEIDGVVADQDITDIADMEELNGCRFITTKLLKERFKRRWPLSKTFKWWVQAHLANVNTIYLAFKDDRGFVNSPGTHVNVKDLAKRQPWKPVVWVGYLDTFLTTVEQKMSGVNCPHTVYEFMIRNQGKQIEYRIHQGQNPLSFLGAKFVEHLQKH